ncbi:unnamed protein product [Calypogeia fissa]
MELQQYCRSGPTDRQATQLPGSSSLYIILRSGRDCNTAALEVRKCNSPTLCQNMALQIDQQSPGFSDECVATETNLLSGA